MGLDGGWYATVSPDASHFAYVEQSYNRQQIYLANRSSRQETLLADSSNVTIEDWSDDGLHLAYSVTEGTEGDRLHVYSLADGVDTTILEEDSIHAPRFTTTSPPTLFFSAESDSETYTYYTWSPEWRTREPSAKLNNLLRLTLGMLMGIQSCTSKTRALRAQSSR